MEGLAGMPRKDKRLVWLTFRAQADNGIEYIEGGVPPRLCRDVGSCATWYPARVGFIGNPGWERSSA
jgi:hypothetical protein